MDKNINYNKQCLGLLGHLALGQPAGQGKAICSSQTLQPQGSLSGVQALDLMKVNQIQDVSDKTFGGHISVFFNETTFHNNISDQPYCQEQFFLFLPLLPLCFFTLLELPVLLYFIAPLLAFPSSCAFLICLKYSLYLPNLKQIYFCVILPTNPVSLQWD